MPGKADGMCRQVAEGPRKHWDVEMYVLVNNGSRVWVRQKSPGETGEEFRLHRATYLLDSTGTSK